jgi:hypothetical protein
MLTCPLELVVHYSRLESPNSRQPLREGIYVLGA